MIFKQFHIGDNQPRGISKKSAQSIPVIKTVSEGSGGASTGRTGEIIQTLRII